MYTFPFLVIIQSLITSPSRIPSSDVPQPYAIATAAQHLTVGGLLNFDFLLASVPTALQIISVSATLSANYTLRSVQRPSKPPQHAIKRTRLFIFDAKNPPCTDTRMLALNSQGSSVSPLAASASAASPTSSAVVDDMTASSSSGSGQCCNSEQRLGNEGSLASDTLPQTIESGGSYHVSHLARLPNDDTIHPSTLKGTKTPIQTRHELMLEVRFAQIGDDGVPGKSLVLRSEHAITLSSVSLYCLSFVPHYAADLAAYIGINHFISPKSVLLYALLFTRASLLRSSQHQPSQTRARCSLIMGQMYRRLRLPNITRRPHRAISNCWGEVES